jgi:1-acyl-sn-glycerol-3-phosphate acyltransferase
LRFPIDSDVEARLGALEIPFNEHGIDPFGISKSHLGVAMTLTRALYKNYFKVFVHGLEHVPARGRAMIVGNHSGGFALDAGTVIASSFFEMTPPRLAQGMAEKFIQSFPLAGTWASRTGQLTGLPEHAVRLLEAERLLMVFPEGAKGTAKLYPNRYDLLHFGSGFVRLALKTKTPIIPMAFLGGGEAVPTVMNAVSLGKLLGVPYIPITPWGLPLPLPVQLDIQYGAPIVLEGTGSEDDDVVAGYVERVRSEIARLIQVGQADRKGVKLKSTDGPTPPPYGTGGGKP